MAGENAHNTAHLDTTIGSTIDTKSWSEPTASQTASPIITTPSHALIHTQSRLIAYNKTNGDIATTQALPGAMAATPAVTDTHVLVPRDTFGEGLESQIDLETPTLYAINRETTDIDWTHSLTGDYLASVAVDDAIYVQSDREVARLDADGTPTWRHTFETAFDWRDTLSYLRPVIGPDSVYVTHRNALLELDSASGTVQWTRDMEKTLFPPTIADESTLVASTSDAIVGVSPSDGQVQWRVEEPPVWGPAVDGDTAVISTNRAILGVDPGSGEVRWRTEQALSTCPPVIAGDTAFTAPGGSRLAAVALETGNPRDSRDTDQRVTWITPDAGGLLTRQPARDGPIVERYALR